MVAGPAAAPAPVPVATRPHMPGYGIVGPTDGSGLLPWSWAEERLAAAHDYWVATTWPDGRPHIMPVWGMWHESCVWFSSSGGSRKTLNLRHDDRCTVATDKASEPVIVEGVAELVDDLGVLAVVLDLENRKYGTDYTMEMLDPGVNACFRVRPVWAFGLTGEDFTGSPTRWVFGS
ncbi:MAG TPA: pyridoxamine 5'-phosphate oxidase family protein [Acidimicrobiales bacterium]|nr:pyridoxamine 5'-phosphate oxidase family protein [Acidimicrobiales bacterium]